MRRILTILACLLVGFAALGQDSITPVDTGGQMTKIEYTWTSDGSGNAVGVSSAIVPGSIFSVSTVPGTSTEQPTDNYDVVVKQQLPSVSGADTVLSTDLIGGDGANRDDTNAELIQYTTENMQQVSGKIRIEVSNAGSANQGKVIVVLYRTLAFADRNGWGIPSGGSATQILQYNSAGRAKWITVSGDATIADNGAVTVADDSHSHTDSTVADALTISGGTINNTPIGASTPSTGAFSTLSSSGAATLNSLGVTGNATVGGTLGVTGAITGAGYSGGPIAGTTGTFTGAVSATDGTFSGDVAVNGGDLTSTATTFNMLNSTVTTLNLGGAATVNIGSGATGISHRIGQMSFHRSGSTQVYMQGATAMAALGIRNLYTGANDSTIDLELQASSAANHYIRMFRVSSAIAGEQKFIIFNPNTSTEHFSVDAKTGNTTSQGTGQFVNGLTTGATSKASDTYHTIRSNAGYWAGTQAYSGSSQRWFWGKQIDAESGSNQGSDFHVNAYDDSGVLIDTPFKIARESAGPIEIGGSSARPVTLTGNLTVNGSSNAVGRVKTYSATVSFNTADFTLTTVPANSIVLYCFYNCTGAWTGLSGALLKVGDATDDDGLLSLGPPLATIYGDNPSEVGDYLSYTDSDDEIFVPKFYTSSTAILVDITTGTAVAGTGTLYLVVLELT